MGRILLLFLFVLQDSRADLLKRDGWKAVDALALPAERAALADLAKSADPDVAFYAAAAVAEIDALKGPGAKALVKTRKSRGGALDICSALFKEAGLSFAAGRLPDREVDLPDGLALLEALDRISRSLDVEFYLGDAGTWKVADGHLCAPRFAFRRMRARLDLIRIESRADFERAPESNCRVRVRISGDGAARILGISAIRVIEAADDKAADLRTRRGARYEDLASGHAVTVDLAAPSRGSSSLRRLRLAFDALLEAKRETATFPRVQDAKDAQAPLGTTGVTLKRIVKEADGWRADVETTAPLVGTRWEGFELLDADGRAYAFVSATPTAGKDHTTYAIRHRARQGVGAPASLAITAVTETFARSVFLEFKDVPLK